MLTGLQAAEFGIGRRPVSARTQGCGQIQPAWLIRIPAANRRTAFCGNAFLSARVGDRGELCALGCRALKKTLFQRVSPRALAALLAISSVAASASAQVLPAGALLDINNGSNANSASNTANVFQNYSVNFTASTSGDNFVLFAFREDPGYWTFGNVALTLFGGGTNLLVDPALTQGGQVGTSGVQAPADWGIINQNGSSPSSAGSWQAPASGGDSSSSGLGVNTSTAGAWVDGAVGSFDGIFQGVNLTSGSTYILSFSALASDTANTSTVSNSGVELGVFSGACSVTTGPASGCSVGSSSGFTTLYTPAQTANAGGPSTTNIDTAQPLYLASNLGSTVNPVFQGGVLKTDQANGAYGQNFTLDGSGTNTIDQAGAASTFSGVYSDAVGGTPGGVIIANSGSGGGVTLTGGNTYTGATTINSGASLLLSGGGSIASSSGVADSGTFDISGTPSGASINSLSGSGSVILGGQTLTLTNASGTFAGDMSGTGGLTLAGGNETLSGANDYSGATIISAGTLTLTGTIANSSGVDLTGSSAVFDTSGLVASTQIKGLSGVAGSQVKLGAKGLTVDQAGATTFAGVISGSGSSALIKDGAGTLTLSGVNTYANATTISGGALALSGSGSIAASSSVTDNGTFDISGTTAGASITTLSGTGVVTLGGQTLTLTTATDTFGGAIGGTGGLTVAGGTETLTGSSAYTGATTIDTGASLILSGGGNIAASSVVADSGTFDISGATSGASIKSLSGGGVATLGGQTLTLTSAADSFGGVIAGTGGLTVAGGTETLGASNAYTGATGINTGATLALSGAGSIATSSGVAANGTFDISGTASGASITTLSGAGAVALGGQTLTLTNAAGAFSGAIGGTGGLTLAGGTETLSGSNAYTGATTINTGASLILSGGGSMAASSVADSGTFDISGATSGASIKSLSGAGAVALGGKTLTLTNAAGAFSGAIAGTGGLTLAGGTETLSGISAYTGATTINTGASLILSGGGGIAASSVADSGTFDISGTTSGASIKSLAGGGVVTLGGQTLTVTNAAGAFSGAIGGTGGLTVAGGTETLGASNAYTGATTINTGASLALSGAGSIATSSGVAANGTFDISGTASGASITTLSGAGAVALGGKTLTLTNAAGSFNGAIAGTGGLTLAGGTETLSGISAYTGATTINTGASLILSGGGSMAASSVADSGTFDISGTTSGASIKSLSGGGVVTLGGQTLTVTSAADSFSGAIGGTGGLTVAGGTETLGGNSAYAGATNINAGATLALSGAGSIATSSGVAANGTLDISGATSGAAIATLSGAGAVALGGRALILTNASTGFNGVVSGSGELRVTGGTQTLAGADTFTGSTFIASDATLALSGAGSIAASDGVGLNGTLDISGTTSGASITSLSGAATSLVLLGGETLTLTDAQSPDHGVISGSGGLTVAGGRLGLSAVNSFTGATTIGAGATLLLQTADAIAASSQVADSGTFDISFTPSGATIGSLSGAGAVTLGDGTLTLSRAAGSFSGVIAADGGTGGLSLAAGTETLTGANSYVGATTINLGASLAVTGGGSIAASSVVSDGGTFDISGTTSGASIKSLSGAGVVTLGGQTLTLTSATDSFSGAINGTGGLAITGGAEILTGASAFTGGTSLSSASLAITSDAALGAASGGLAMNNAALITLQNINSARTVSLTGLNALDTAGQKDQLSGVIGGSGALAVTGGGQLALTGANTYAGGTLITGGATLVVGADSALGAAGGAITFDHGALAATADFTTARPILVASGGGAIDADGFTVNLDGPITLNGALSTVGAGKVYFTSDAQVNGVLAISEGQFSNNGQISAQALTVAPGATLRGIGEITAPTTVSGTLAPGNSPGTLTFNARVTLQATATTEFDIDGPGTGTGGGNYGRVIVLGAGDSFTAGGVLAPRLRGITGSASNTFTPVIGQQFQVISAAGGLLGGYASLTQPAGLAAGERFDALYSPTALSLVVTPAAYADLPRAGIAETAAEKAVGAVLDANRPAAGVRMSAAQAALYYPLYTLPGAKIPAVLNQVSPQIYADAVMAARQSWRQGAASIGDELADRRGLSGSAVEASGPNGVTLWGDAIGQINDVGHADGDGYHSTVGGAMVGVDKTLGGGDLVGFAVGGGNLRTSAQGGAAATGDLIQASVYGGLRRGDWFVDWQGDYLHLAQDTSRTVSLAAQPIKGRNTIWGGGGQIDAGLNLRVQQWRVEPTVGLNAMTLTSTATAESSGGALAESVRGLDNTSVQTFVGVRLAGTLVSIASVPLRMHGVFGWSHELDQTTANAQASLANMGAAVFSAASTPVGRDAARLGVSLDARLTAKVTLFGAYTASLSNDQSAQYLNAGVRIRW